jgi:hypothetical protein
MRPVAVRILHPDPAPDAGPLERWVAAARLAVADRHRRGFIAVGADDVAIVAGPPDDTPFGRRLRRLVEAARLPGGLVVLGSGAIPLATRADRLAFVAVAGGDGRRALTNNRYSADVVALTCAADGLAAVPDLPGDNALPRWLAEDAGYEVADLHRRWRLAIDLDGPLDVILAGVAVPVGVLAEPVLARLAAIRAVAADPRAELLVAGRTSAATLGWLERHTASRTRAIVEERGLRTARPGQRPPSSILGALLERDGAGALGSILARLADAALVDTRVLLAHRLGADERVWPRAEDRFASDLLLPDEIVDPWLRDLTRSALQAPIPVLLGGHTLVGPGVRLVVRS